MMTKRTKITSHRNYENHSMYIDRKKGEITLLDIADKEYTYCTLHSKNSMRESYYNTHCLKYTQITLDVDKKVKVN